MTGTTTIVDSLKVFNKWLDFVLEEEDVDLKDVDQVQWFFNAVSSKNWDDDDFVECDPDLLCGYLKCCFHQFKQFCICPECKNKAERQYSMFSTNKSRVQA